MPSVHSSPSPKPAAVPLRVLRVKAGEKFHLRALDSIYGGIFTHFVRGRSAYCAGDECFPANHRTERFWKGYSAVEVYDRVTDMWVPWVLEITEALELDFRDRWARGVTWAIERMPEATKKKMPLKAELIEVNDPATLPPCFDIIPCLLTLYHATRLQLDQKNPLPARTVLQPTKGAPPPGFGSRKATEEVGTLADWQRLRESALKGRNGNGNGGSSNGK
jgi:hypothetical protein